MLHIGCHLSSTKGFLSMGMDALNIHADTFQFFTRNPRGSKAKTIDPEDAQKLLQLMEEHNFTRVIGHGPYTLNPCAADLHKRTFAAQTMADDLHRMEYLPGQLYNFHPGSHVGQGLEKGIYYITEMLNENLTENQTTTVLLETMSGKGTEVGGRFEELQAILAGVHFKEKMGICLDTCHVFDAGYDIVHDLDGVLEEFDAIIGLHKLKAIHLNDSLNSIGSRKDRHARIGEGEIGLDAIVRIIKHPKLRHLLFCLETPNELEGYAKEIQLLRSL